MNLISKHLPKNMAKIKDHLSQEMMNLNSTKTFKYTPQDLPPLQEDSNIRTNDIVCAIFSAE